MPPDPNHRLSTTPTFRGAKTALSLVPRASALAAQYSPQHAPVLPPLQQRAPRAAAASAPPPPPPPPPPLVHSSFTARSRLAHGSFTARSQPSPSGGSLAAALLPALGPEVAGLAADVAGLLLVGALRHLCVCMCMCMCIQPAWACACAYSLRGQCRGVGARPAADCR